MTTLMSLKVSVIWILIVILMMFTGCDRVESVVSTISSSITTTAKSESHKIPKIKATGYYVYDVDTPFIGIEYQCGKLSGVTDKDGGFKFYLNGRDCIFEVGGVPVRYIYSAELYDNIVLQETDDNINTFLLSLDKDSNPSRGGVLISSEVKRAIKKLDLKEVPNSPVVLQATIGAINERIKRPLKIISSKKDEAVDLNKSVKYYSKI